jgi:hypothetical protein
MSFDQLKGELADLAKSYEPTDENAKVAAAAEDGKQAGEAANGEKGTEEAAASAAGAAEGKGEGEGKGANPEDAEDAGAGEAGKVVAKSFTLQLENGDEVEAFDATELMLENAEMLKSFGARVELMEADAKTSASEVIGLMTSAIQIIRAQGATIASLQKSFTEQTELATANGELIKSLRADLDAVRSSGGGRKSAANPSHVQADSPLVKSLQGGEGEGLQPQEFLAKCLTLQKDGVLSLQECALAEAAIGSNVPVHPAIVSKVFSHK